LPSKTDEDAIAELAIAVIAAATEDAILARDNPKGMEKQWRKMQGGLEPRCHPLNVMGWINETRLSHEPGTFGWWCDAAGLDRRFVLDVIFVFSRQRPQRRKQGVRTKPNQDLQR